MLLPDNRAGEGVVEAILEACQQISIYIKELVLDKLRFLSCPNLLFIELLL
jgi:ribosome-binding factor A